MFLSNIIFPAPSAVYVSTFFVPLATVLALATELFVFRYYQRGVVSDARLAGVVLALNFVSWVVGLILSGFLPSGLVPTLVGEHQVLQPGPQFGMLLIAGYFFACFVSAILEYGGVLLLFRRVQLRSPLRCVAFSNAASFAVLALIVSLGRR